MLLAKIVPQGESYVRIPASKRAAMRVILETVQRGSRYWSGGVIHCSKALRFADKMAERYHANATQAQRAYAKAHGRANTTLLMYPENATAIRFWLLVTVGKGAVHEQETLLDSHDKRERLMWGEQYQLEHAQRSREQGGGRAWTWRMAEERYAQMEASMQLYAAASGRGSERVDDLDSLVRAVLRMPGFHGIRQQQLTLLRLGRHVWTRTHRANNVYPWPEKVPFLDKGFRCYHVPQPLTLDVLVVGMARQTDGQRERAIGEIAAAPQPAQNSPRL